MGPGRASRNPGHRHRLKQPPGSPGAAPQKVSRSGRLYTAKERTSEFLDPEAQGTETWCIWTLEAKAEKNPGRKWGTKPQRLPLLRIPFCSPQELSSPGPYLSFLTPASTLKVKYMGATHSSISEDEAGGQGSCPRLVEHAIHKVPSSEQQLRQAGASAWTLCVPKDSSVTRGF